MAKEEEAVVGSSTHGQWLSCPCKKCFRQHLNTIILVSPVKESDGVEIFYVLCIDIKKNFCVTFTLKQSLSSILLARALSYFDVLGALLF